MKKPTWFPEAAAPRALRNPVGGHDGYGEVGGHGGHDPYRAPEVRSGGRRRAAGKGRHGRRPQSGFRLGVPTSAVVGVAAAVLAGGIFALSGSDGDSGEGGETSAAVREIPADSGADGQRIGGLSGLIPPATIPTALPSAKPPESSEDSGGDRSRSPHEAESPSTSRNKNRKTQPAPDPSKQQATGAGKDKAVGKAARFGEQLVELVNAERATAGCEPLRVNARMQAVAQAHADDMAARDYYEHVDTEGRHADERLRAAGYPVGMWGENLHRGPEDPVTAMIGWMNSPTHRDNILDCDYEDFGVGVNLSGNGPWWVQNFGTEY
ncbi:CAP domain-containing protein [Streptomyces sp. NPDC127084]|uniref:CAP domain-containing protein n=1 Tax=Streptomyces sp. NPDC127084 TaxID=3347133 RepID=UPI003660771D